MATMVAMATAMAMASGWAAGAAASKPARTHAAAPIPYDELEHHVGERIVVHTTFGSTRVGTLVKVSKMELTLDMPTASGTAELTMPKNTVVRVLPAPAAKPAKPAGAKH